MTTIGPETWEWWLGAWQDVIVCGRCRGFLNKSMPCPVCGHDYRTVPPQKIEVDGRIVMVQSALMGALNWSDYIMLRLMHQEWQRPLAAQQLFAGIPTENRPSSRLLIVILYWSLFENLVSRLFENAMQHLPESVSLDLLNRYSSIGSRMDRLYRIIFGSTLRADLVQLGFEDLANHLLEVQKRRNAFIHGEPEVINEGLVKAAMDNLHVLQDAWIRLYNFRCAEPNVQSS